MAYLAHQLKKAIPPTWDAPPTPVGAMENFANFASLTPWQAASGTAATAAAERIATPSSGLLAMLQERAREGMAAGGSLSTEEVRAATQGGRAAASARGMLNSPGGILMEIMSRAQASHARRRDRENFAAGVLGLENATQAGNADALKAASASSLAGLALPEEVRQFNTTRDDTLTFNRNQYDMDMYTADKNSAAANKAARGSAMGGIASGVGALAALAFL